ncbi:MAG: hypothetical protein ACLSUW_05900 [Akkermansia sp.]
MREILAGEKSPLLEKRLSAVDDVLVLVRGGASPTLQRLMLVNVRRKCWVVPCASISARAWRTAYDRLALTVLGVVPAENGVPPRSALKPETAAPVEPELVPEESLLRGRETIQPSFPAAMPEPEPERPVPPSS